MLTYLWIGLGGFFGANARYMVQVWAAQRWGSTFPYGTMLANVSGSFIIALFLTLSSDERFLIAPELRFFFAVGFLGGFTTFSSFSYETFQQFQYGGLWMATLNFLGNTVLSLVGVLLAFFVAGLIQRGVNH
jgi:CrcB protein